MVKAYLRYEPAGVFGVVSSGSSCCYDCSGQLLVTAALENVAVWNVKQGALVRWVHHACVLAEGRLTHCAQLTTAGVGMRRGMRACMRARAQAATACMRPSQRTHARTHLFSCATCSSSRCHVQPCPRPRT